MATLKERIQELVQDLLARGIDRVELARVAGVSKATVTQWAKGDIKSLKLEYASAIEAAYGYRAVWLVLGRGPKLVTDQGSLLPAHQPWPFSAAYDAYLALPQAAKERLNEKVSDFIEGATAALPAPRKSTAKTGTANR